MSKVKVEILDKMLKALTKKTGLTLSMKSLNSISEQIPGVGDTYLYKKIQSQIVNRKKSDYVGLREDQLNCVALYLGYDDFNSLSLALQRNNDDQLSTLVGSYYSYVRANSKVCNVLRSPIKIWQKPDGTIWIQLKGPANIFKGEIVKKHGCLFILLESSGGKMFFHTYKIGERKSPAVLQGIFSGVSTGFDPIGGRAVLIRVDEPYDVLSNASLDRKALRKSSLAGEKDLGEYFAEYSKNNLALNRSTTFGVADLQ